MNQESHGYVLLPGKSGSFISSLNKIFKPRGYSLLHSLRIDKLFKVFNELLRSNATGEYRSLFVEIENSFGYTLPSSHLLDDNDYLNKIVVLARKKLAERDLQSIKEQHALVNTKVDALVDNYCKAWPDQGQSTISFLKETVPAMLKFSTPLLSVLDKIQEDFASAIESGIESDLISELGLSKYFIGRGVFSMKKSESRILATSGLTKILLDLLRSNNYLSDPSFEASCEQHLHLQGNSTSSTESSQGIENTLDRDSLF
jgi:hypothetical protein